MKILTLDDASGYGGQQYYVDDEGKYAGLVPANQPTTPANNVSANQAPTFSTPGAADYNPYTNPNATEEEKIKFRQDSFTYSPTNEPELTPMQQLAQATQAKIGDVGFDTYKKKDGEYNVRFDDGSSLFDQDLLDQYGVNKKDFASALRGYGNYIGAVGNRQSAGAGFAQGLENILNPEEAQKAYQDQLAYNKKEDKEQVQRDATRQKLDTQVAREAEALGISVKDYYELPATMRVRMAGSDITELFKGDNSGLGVLGDVNLAKYQEEVLPYKGKGGNDPLDFTGFEQRYADDGVTPPLGGGFTIPGTNITITAPEGDMRSNGGYGGGAGSGSGDQYGTRPRFGAFANVSGGGGGGIWDRFRNSYLTEYGLEGQSEDMDEIKVSYDPENNVYFYPDGTIIDPADLEGLDISDTFEEQTGTERFKL